jgi:hypothetical protein
MFPGNDLPIGTLSPLDLRMFGADMANEEWLYIAVAGLVVWMRDRVRR